ncbi:Pimeloyl-ACP methyl ester carboxylesterase [Tsukamurella pulmonis]|uniref:Pimeloyl-ACP methyl ester carboxylesterase n=1 Tax=Tsukamurella pulmonis TaxID=47312 RepID=A0A1H1AZ81_9ACTN|nr:alpha/beta hydrolase [Tsukamurella pulmonis]SDQ44942.1 Pimeloyl-ACP methyl ester carboxylesterase [Tsukamurella pulmonis]SUP25886.1 Haloacetate dehalogenase H-1 [Tsukamurella pulmonis]
MEIFKPEEVVVMIDADVAALRRASVDLTLLTWGTPGDPLVLLLHGFPDSAHTWDRLGPELAANGRYVVAPFTRGYAPSGLARDDDYSLVSLIDDVVAVHRWAGGDARAVLIGHDWGGAIADAAAAAHPDLFERVVLIAIPPLPAILALSGPAHFRAALRQLPRSWYMPVLNVPILSDLLGRRLIDRLWSSWRHSPDRDARGNAHAALPDRRRRRAAFSYYRALWNPCFHRRRRELPRQWNLLRSRRSVPTLLIQGADDTCGLASTSAHALDHLPPGSRRTVVPDSGHFAHLDQPDAISRCILGYLKGTSRDHT